MALTNAISSVSFVAALIVLAEPSTNYSILLLATAAVALAFTNIVSGFLLTERILRLFKRKDDQKK